MAKKKKAQPQELAFLADVIANGGDDTPRLVFADWLEDNGQPHRAEFIRLQCQLASLDDDDPRREAMQERERDLLGFSRGEWSRSLPAFAKDSSLAFRRGFVDRVSVTAAEFLKKGEALFAAAPLRDLHLRSAGGRMAEAAGSPLLSRLTALDLGGSRLPDEDVVALTGSPHLGGLTSLSLRQTGGSPARAERLAQWPQLPRLTCLDLSGNQVSPAFAQELAKSPPLPSLRRLDVSGILQHGASLRALMGGGRVAGLTHLAVTWWASEGAVVEGLTEPGALPVLKHLDVSSSLGALWLLEALGKSDLFAGLDTLKANWMRLDARSLSALLRPGRTGRLRHLDLSNNPDAGTPAAMEALASASLGLLRSLDLRDVRLRGAGLRVLLGAPWVAGVRSLCLSGNPLGDEGVQAIAESPHLNGLTSLSLAGAHLGPQGAARLAAWPGLAGVRHLHLGSNSLGPDGVTALAKSPYVNGAYYLGLVNASLGDEGVRALAASPNLENLRILNLWGYRPTDESALRELANSSRLPRLLVLAVRDINVDSSAELEALGRTVVREEQSVVQKKKPPPQEQVFLDDVAANGGDDAPRLVFADWLEDQGQSHRAEFIRLQCRLATMDDGDPERDVSKDRERELLAVYRKEWAKPLPASARRGEYAFRRGFVERVSVTATEFLKKGVALFAAAPIRDLRLRSAGGRMAEVAASPLLGRLEALDLQNFQLTDADFAALTRSPHLGGLTELSLRGFHISARNAGALGRWRQLPSLSRLDLSLTRLDYDGFQALTESSPLSSLRRLHLAGIYLGPGSADALVAGGRLSGLTHLEMQWAANDRVMRTLVEPGALPRLESLTANYSPECGAMEVLGRSDLLAGLLALDLQTANLAAESLRELTRHGRTGNLRHLDLGRNPRLATPEAMAVLASASLDSLHSLDLIGTQLRDEAVRVLAGAPWLRGLRSLALGSARLGNDSVRALTQSPHLSGLTSLSLGSGIGPRGAALLAAWPGLARLRNLSLDHNPLLGPDGVAALARSPHLRNVYRLSLRGVDPGDEGVRALAASPHLENLRVLDLWIYRPDGSSALRELANSPRLPRLLILKAQTQDDSTAELKALGRTVVL